MIALRPDTETPVGTGPVVLPRVNLLPPEIAEQVHVRRLQAGLAAAVVLAALAVAVLYAASARSVGAAQDDLAAATARTVGVHTQVAGLRDVTAVYARAATAQQMLTAAMGREVRYSVQLTDLAQSLPPHLWLTSASWAQGDPAVPAGRAATGPVSPGGPVGRAAGGGIGTLTLAGVADTHRDVATWLDTLAASPQHGEVTLQSSTDALVGSHSVVTWTATATLTVTALSGRYPAPTGR